MCATPNPAPISSFDRDSPLCPLHRADLRFFLFSAQVFPPPEPNKPPLAPIAAKPCRGKRVSSRFPPPRRKMHPSQPLDSISKEEIDAEKYAKRRARAEHEKPRCTNNN
jgi:hypothetical protein